MFKELKAVALTILFWEFLPTEEADFILCNYLCDLDCKLEYLLLFGYNDDCGLDSSIVY
jgi:hypothetical protein